MCSIRNCAQPFFSLLFVLYPLTLTAEDLLAGDCFLWYTGDTDEEINGKLWRHVMYGCSENVGTIWR